MIDCRQAVARMWAYLSGAPEPSDPQLEEHLGACLRCCGELEFTRQLRSRIASSETEAMPSATRARLRQILDQVPPTEVR